jgi:phosphatidylglycerophosphatase A
MKGRANTPPSVWRNPIHFAAFGFGAGAIKIAPGTFGTVAAIPLYILLQDLPLLMYISITAALFLLGIWLCQITTRDLGVHDHSGIVWDEIVGYLITMAAAPSGGLWIVLGFVLFRLFDIWKPWPINLLDQHVKGGFGVMIDDVMAGIYAWLVMQGIYLGL